MAVDAAGNPIIDGGTVSAIQKMLGVQDTGSWDAQTRTAFNSFQSSKGWGLTYGLTGDASQWQNLIKAMQTKDTTPVKTGADNPPVTPTNPNGTPDQQSAKAIIGKMLADWGLGKLTDWATGQIAAGNTNILPQLLRDTTEYKERFSGNGRRVASGQNALSEQNYLQLEDHYRDLMKQYGLPEGFYTSQAEMANLIAGNISPEQLTKRLQMYSSAATQAPVELRNELQRLYGVSPGELTAFFIDPSTALPLIEQRYNAAGAASAADRGGFTQIAQATAERLASLGVSGSAADVSQFTKLSNSTELFNPLQLEQGQSITNDEAAVAAFGGDGTTQTMLVKRAGQRVADMSGGGTVLANNKGVSGLADNSS